MFILDKKKDLNSYYIWIVDKRKLTMAQIDDVQQAVESFFLLFNGVVIFCKLFNKKNQSQN